MTQFKHGFDAIGCNKRPTRGSQHDLARFILIFDFMEITTDSVHIGFIWKYYVFQRKRDANLNQLWNNEYKQ